MNPALTIVLRLRDQESAVVSMVRGAVMAARSMIEQREERPSSDSPTFEVLAVDERSGDNTLSHLSILHGQIPQLRTYQDVAPGRAIAHATKVARGDHWVVVDRPVDVSLVQWAIRMVRSGRSAAIVPGEVLAVEASVARAALVRLRGDLVSAQQAIEQVVRASGQRPAWCPAPDRGITGRAVLFMRRQLGRVGLGRFVPKAR